MKPWGHQGNPASHLYDHLEGKDTRENVVHVLQNLEPKEGLFSKARPEPQARPLQQLRAFSSRARNRRPAGGGLQAVVMGRGGEARRASPWEPTLQKGAPCSALEAPPDLRPQSTGEARRPADRTPAPPGPLQPDGHTHVVPGRVCLHGVLSSQGDAAQGDDHENDHLKVPHGHNVMAEAAEPGGQSTGHRRPARGLGWPLPAGRCRTRAEFC